MSEKNFIQEVVEDDWCITIILGSLFGSLTVALFWYLNKKLVLVDYPGETLDIINNTAFGTLVFIALLICFFLARMKRLAGHPLTAVGVFIVFTVASASITGLILNFGWLGLKIFYSIVAVIMFLGFACLWRGFILSDYD